MEKLQVEDVVLIQGKVVGFSVNNVEIKVDNNVCWISKISQNIKLIDRPKKQDDIQIYGWKHNDRRFPEYGDSKHITPDGISAIVQGCPNRWTRVPELDRPWDMKENGRSRGSL